MQTIQALSKQTDALHIGSFPCQLIPEYSGCGPIPQYLVIMQVTKGNLVLIFHTAFLLE